MRISKKNLNKIDGSVVELPSENLFGLPEKVLQFGTGVLLRGLPDYYIDKANKQGIFNGRIVVVKSTDSGSTDEFDEQDSLYTLCIRGIESGAKVEKNIVSSAISRVLVAGKQWQDILNFAASPNLQVILSNTTEVGIQLIDDDVYAYPPASFPGKLLAVLFHRYKIFNGAEDRGLVIVPTELIPNNANKLKDILVTLAKKNEMPLAFIKWMQKCNTFCNSLVDRIVPGKPDANMADTINQQLGYEDALLSMSEVYSLWAIEGDEKVAEKLSFAKADKGVVITPDIDLHRELKLRLLNGTHTLSCAVAFLAGFDTVKNSMDDPFIEAYISNLMKEEIAPAIPYEVSKEVTDDFADKVLDRFKNPHIKHQWISISMNYTSKLRMRVLPVLLNHYSSSSSVPELVALGFAAYIKFMECKFEGGAYYGTFNNQLYVINDDKAAHICRLYKKYASNIAQEILKDITLWGTDLTTLPGFEESVTENLKEINQYSIQKRLAEIGSKRIVA